MLINTMIKLTSTSNHYNTSIGRADCAALCVNMDANHSFTKCSPIFSCGYLFLFYAMKIIYFWFWECPNFILKLIKIRTNLPLLVICKCFTYINTSWNIFFDFNMGKQFLFLRRQFICLFQNCVGAKPSRIWGPFIEHTWF